MAEQTEDQAGEAPGPAPRRRRTKRRVAGIVALILAAAVAWAWFSREDLADNLIAAQLDKMGIEASYRIEEIGPRREVISHVVVGDPRRPDLTIERVEITLVPRLPLLGPGEITLVKPRLYGTYAGGKLSFGSLDKVLFEQPSTEPFTLPDLDLRIDDGRALLESEYGPVGVKAQGNGNLRSGFAGIVAATAPRLAMAGCLAEGATLYGKATIENAHPGFSGPLRIASLACPDRELSLGASAMDLTALVDPDFRGLEGELGMKGGALAVGGNRLAGLAGSGKFEWRRQGLTAQYELRTEAAETAQLALGTLAAEGSIRTRKGVERAEIQADLTGEGLRPGAGLDAALRDAAGASIGTLAGPMLEQIRTVLAREGRGSSFSARLTLRKAGDALSLVMPEARLRGSGGDVLLGISRLQYSSAPDAPRLSGNFTTGGPGLPRIAGRMEQGSAGEALLHLRMEEYRVKGGSLALPELMVVQGPGGALGFAGTVHATGALPGGFARNLRMPVSGNWSPANGLSVWRKCAGISFDSLTLANLTIAKRRLRLCPPRGGAIVRSDGGGTRIAAGAPALDLTGRLGETRVALRTGAVGLAWPGSLNARDVDVELGPAESATRFRLSQLSARIDSEVRGKFAGADAFIFAVPLDILEASGEWRYAGGRLELTGGAFRLEDREQVDRFQPFVARDASLALEDNRITAEALLREPNSDRAIADVTVNHDLSTGAGHAGLDVAALRFDEQLQPDTLTPLALGVIANAKGAVQGTGRIDWDTQTVTSSGEFSTSGLDFAAAFGPVEGVSGTVTFTDLLGLVTAPDQRLRIRSFNPGIQVDEGELIYELRPGYELVVHGGSWPFIGGRLILEPATTHLGVAETRRYTIRLEGVDAAQFVERMELANIAATGTFDGAVPLVFDENGGRIVNGRLVSRPPGGNLSYVGGLTYEDLSAMANFAFDALRSLDYREMEILLDGSLTGEIVTRVHFDGIRQGENARQNFITRQLARVPIRFNVNIHAPFYQLITAIHSIYDPAYVRDPRDLGLIDAQGRPTTNPVLHPEAVIRPEDLPSGEASIQPPDSEPVP